jgi:hypothetical protein
MARFYLILKTSVRQNSISQARALTVPNKSCQEIHIGRKTIYLLYKACMRLPESFLSMTIPTDYELPVTFNLISNAFF